MDGGAAILARCEHCGGQMLQSRDSEIELQCAQCSRVIWAKSRIPTKEYLQSLPGEKPGRRRGRRRKNTIDAREIARKAREQRQARELKQEWTMAMALALKVEREERERKRERARLKGNERQRRYRARLKERRERLAAAAENEPELAIAANTQLGLWG